MSNPADAADPTMALIEALNRGEEREWGRIIKGMPIFVEHDGYEVGEGKEKRLVVVPKGESPPANARLLYSVDRDRLQETVQAINRNYDEWGKPIKLFLGQSREAAGHSDPSVPQTENPAIVGFGRRAYLGTFGPKGRLAIKTDAFYKRGHERDPEEYPERSPEFLPRTNAITGVALLKTDPRLPMGMLAFSQDQEVIYYGVGFMPADAKPDEKKTPETGVTSTDDKLAPWGQDNPGEVKFYERFVKHMEENHAAFKHYCGEYKKYQETQAAMTAPSATNGYLPGDAQTKKPDERMDMSQTITDQDRINYAETKAELDKLKAEHAHDKAELEKLKAENAGAAGRLAKLEEENGLLYAEEAISALEKQGKVIKNRKKEIDKLVALKTLEERQARLLEIKENYADLERSPARGPSWLPVDAGHAEGAEQPVKIEAADLLRYAEEHKLDLEKQSDLDKAVAALSGKK